MNNINEKTVTSSISKQIKLNFFTRSLVTKKDLAKGLSETKTDMIKWFTALFLVLAILVIGLYLK